MPALVRIRDVLLTVLVWAAYFFLIRVVPIWLLLRLAEILSWHEAAAELAGIEPAAADARVILTLAGYTVIVVINAIVLVSWAQYNLRRFGGLDRRRPPPPVTPEDQGRFFGRSAEEIVVWQSARELTMLHDSSGRLDVVRVDVPSA